MARVLIICTFLTLVVAVALAQEDCGDAKCGEDECCLTEGDSQKCAKRRRKYELCFENSTILCPCKKEFECRRFIFLTRCQDPNPEGTTVPPPEEFVLA